MDKILQLLRNSVLTADRTAAEAALNAKLADLSDGEIIVNRYGDGSKALVGIAYVSGDTRQLYIIDTDAVPSDVQDAIDALETELKGLITAEETARTEADTTLQSNIDAEEEARKAVTGQDGDTYVSNTTANYISDATSLNDADTKLDAAIKSLADEIETTNYVKTIEQALKTDENYSTSEADIYTVTHGDDTADSLQLTFTPISPLSLTIPETIGDFEQGTACSELNGKPLSEILDSILFKTIYPTVTNPSGSVSFASGYTTNAILAAGVTSPSDSNMTYSFNQGSVVVDDGVTATLSYVGAASGCAYVYKYTPGTANTNAGVAAGGTAVTDVALDGAAMTVGTYEYKGTISYAEGPTMATSKGTTPNPMPTTNAGDVANPHAAGTLTTSYNVRLYVTLPVFIDNTATGTFTQQTLKTWGSMTYTGVSMAATTAANPIQIKTPRKLSAVNSYNAVSGKYDVAQLTNFTMSEVTETVNGIDRTYYLYVWTGGALSAVNMEVITY